jgi:carboxylesterase
MIPLTLAAILIAVLLWRAGSRRYIERAAAARLPVAASGIIPGAEPIDLAAPESAPGLLLLHGFGDTPQTLDHLARELHARGYGIFVPLLPGHGRTLREFRASGATAWLDAARRALEELEERHERVGIVGLSMGGALGAILAAEHADTRALVLLAPYLVPRERVRLVARTASLVGALTPYLSSRDERSIRDPIERARALGYGVSTPRLVAELVRVADRGLAALPGVRVPTLYIQSREDNRLDPEGAVRAFDAIGAQEKRLEWLTGAGHVITVDYGWRHVADTVGDWLDETLSGREPHRATR